MENAECLLTAHFLKGEKGFCEKCVMTNYKTPVGEAHFCWRFNLLIGNMVGRQEWVIENEWTAERFVKGALQPLGPKPDIKILGSDN